MTTITNATTPTVPSFEVLLAKMMPYFRHFASQVIRRMGKTYEFEDIIQELTGWALLNYTSLVQRGREVFYTPLFKYAIKRYRAGRRFATGWNGTDITSELTQRMGRSEVCSLDAFDDDGYRDTMSFMTDRRVNVADTVRFKIDFEDWLEQQTPKDKEIIHLLMIGESPYRVARKCRVSPAYICQCRQQYADSWEAFIADKKEPATKEEGLANKEVA